MRNFIFVSLLTVAVACDDRESPVTQMRINHYLQVGHYPYPRFVYLVQKDNSIGSNEWVPFPGPIEGLEFEMGYIYDIDAVLDNGDPHLMDDTGEEGKLVSVRSKEKVPDETPFEIRLSRAYDNGGFEKNVMGDQTSGFKFFNDTSIDCGDLCDLLAQNLEDKRSLVGVFNHAPNGIKLIDLKNQ